MTLISSNEKIGSIQFGHDDKKSVSQTHSILTRFKIRLKYSSLPLQHVKFKAYCIQCFCACVCVCVSEYPQTPSQQAHPPPDLPRGGGFGRVRRSTRGQERSREVSVGGGRGGGAPPKLLGCKHSQCRGKKRDGRGARRGQRSHRYIKPTKGCQQVQDV